MKKKQQQKSAKPRIKHVDLRHKTTLLCWLILLISVGFGVYKNFTAIDTHTTHQKTIVKTKLVDTTPITTFVTDFARVYYAWEPKQEQLDWREVELKKYLPNRLMTLNSDVIRSDIPTKSTVKAIKIWQVKQIEPNNYQVLFSVDQDIERSKGKDKEVTPVTASYTTTVFQNNQKNLVITQNPTIAAVPTKANFKEEIQQADGSVDSDTVKQIEKFLTTFFTLYPKGSENELKYYVEGGTKPLNKDYKFGELINPIFKKTKNKIDVQVTVKYLDTATDMTQLSQYNIVLKKTDDNWIIESGL